MVRGLWRHEKSGRNQNCKIRRFNEKEANINLDRFAGLSEDEVEPSNKRNKKQPVVVEGKRFAKRARKELAAQKKKQEQESESTTAMATVTTSTKSSEPTPTNTTKNKLSKPFPPSGWQLQGGVVAKDVNIGAVKPWCTVCITYTKTYSGRVFDTNSDFPEVPATIVFNPFH